MGNINSAICNYNICSDDLYELDSMIQEIEFEYL